MSGGREGFVEFDKFEDGQKRRSQCFGVGSPIGRDLEIPSARDASGEQNSEHDE